MQFFLLMTNYVRKGWKYIISWLNLLNNNIQERVDNFGSQIVTFGIVGTINYPVYYIIWSFGAKQAYESFTLRLIATLLCIPLIFKNYWPTRLKPFLHLYWYITLLFCLPLFFTFFLLKNHGSAVWLMSTTTVIFWLLLLVDWLSFVILTIIGITVAYFGYYITTPYIYMTDYKGLLAQFMGTFAVIAIFAHNKERYDKVKLKTLSSIGATIAHELRTPLRSISSNATGIKSHLPTLLISYKIASDKNIEIPYIDQLHYEGLQNACETIESEAQYGFTFIDMLLVKASESAINSGNQICSISKCVDMTLKRYPFDIGEKALIKWESENDFLFKGDELLIIHVLFNLLKNAFYYIKAASKGTINIWLELSSEANKLHFKDTGQGISKRILPHIFERFFSRTQHGTGIGLYFCKLVMQAIGGQIVCYSKEGEYTEFILIFPHVSIETPKFRE